MWRWLLTREAIYLTEGCACGIVKSGNAQARLVVSTCFRLKAVTSGQTMWRLIFYSFPGFEFGRRRLKLRHFLKLIIPCYLYSVNAVRLEQRGGSTGSSLGIPPSVLPWKIFLWKSFLFFHFYWWFRANHELFLFHQLYLAVSVTNEPKFPAL